MGRTSNARQRLMGAAHDLIWNYSYGAVTIDAICERAAVKKGSFYYFFDSKSDLALAAINEWWEERKALVDTIFTPAVPPLDRIRRYIDFAAKRQLDVYAETGRILGCPIFTLGSEICKQNEPLRELIDSILTTGINCFQQAVHDANEAGDIQCRNVPLKAKQLWSFYEGTLSRARIENNPELIANLSADALELIGARQPEPVLS
jgi:TetR/AcrR family transcriptional regulator, transcriptional repressor for nem operon